MSFVPFILFGNTVAITQPRIVDLTIPLSGLDTEALLRDWRWLVPSEFTPVQMSKFGHWFFSDPGGRMHYLDLIEGDLRQIAQSIGEYNRWLSEAVRPHCTL